jgi:multiple sugar transport system ATP-binding protein
VRNQGVLQQVGTPEDVYPKPVNVFVAGFIGSPAMNLVAAPVVGAGDDDLIAGFRPEHVRPGNNGNAGAVHFEGSVEVVEYLGDEQIAHLAVGETAVVAKLPIEERLSSGSVEQFTVARDNVHLFDAQTQEAVGR